jgi:hypothetical protein
MHFTTDALISLANFLLTALILVIGYYQLKSFNKTNTSQFLNDLETKLFTNEAIVLIEIIDSNCLVFNVNNNYPFFKVNTVEYRKKYPFAHANIKDHYTTYEIDMILLNRLDIIGSHVFKKTIDFQSSFQYFGWYISTVVHNPAIKGYLQWIANHEKASFVFENLIRLNNKFEKHKLYPTVNNY